MGKKGVVFATDRRLSYAAAFLAEAGLEIREAVRLPGDAVTADVPSGSWAPAETDLVLLPIRGTVDGTIALPGGSRNAAETAGSNAGALDIGPFLTSLRRDAFVFAGVRTPYLTALPCRFCCYQSDPVFAAANAELASEGVLWLLLTKTPRSLSAYCYDILGAGRVGRAVGTKLTKLGLPVRYVDVTGAPDTLAPDAWQKTKPADVVINTAPKPLISRSLIAAWREAGAASEKDPVYIMDIATGQVGVEEDAKGMPGTVYVPAPPLPGFVAPETAGKLIAEALLRAMKK